MTRYYYAASHPYGLAHNSNTGRPIRNLYAFTHRAVRDEWVERRPTDYHGNSGYRSVVPSSDLDLRRVQRDAQREEERYGHMMADYITVVEWDSVAEWDAVEAAERAAFYID